MRRGLGGGAVLTSRGAMTKAKVRHETALAITSPFLPPSLAHGQQLTAAALNERNTRN